MEDSGAQALTAEEILRIPTVKISGDQVLERLQCSVCLDYFKSDDSAKVLLCKHHFHDSCIVPWLELRGTCPDCRRPLATADVLDGTFEDEETWSGYESAHSDVVPTIVSFVSRMTDFIGVRIVQSGGGDSGGGGYYENVSSPEGDYSDEPSVISVDDSSPPRGESFELSSDESDDAYPPPPKTRRYESESSSSSRSSRDLTPSIYTLSDSSVDQAAAATVDYDDDDDDEDDGDDISASYVVDENDWSVDSLFDDDYEDGSIS